MMNSIGAKPRKMLGMGKIELDGVYTQKVRRKLANGKVRVHVYYRYGKDGPKIEGEPGSHEFFESYQFFKDRHRNKTIVGFSDVFDAYQASSAWDELRPKTRNDYQRYINKLKSEFNHYSVRALEDPRIRKEFSNFHEAMSATPTEANRTLACLQSVMGWAKRRGHTLENHSVGIDKFEEGNRADVIWEELQIARIPLLQKQIKLPTIFALLSGQRKEDILKLRWSSVGNEYITICQSKKSKKAKSGTWVFIYIGTAMRRLFDEIPRTDDNEFVFLNSRGTAWSSGFDASRQKAFKAAGIQGVTFHDLRGTFENRAWEADCTEAQTYAITGRRLNVNSANSYFKRSKTLSKKAIEKIESQFGEHQGINFGETVRETIGKRVLRTVNQSK